MAVPPQNTGVGIHCVSLLSSLYFSWSFLDGYVPLLALVFLPIQSTVVVLVILTAVNLPDHITSSLRSSCSFLLTRRPSFCIKTFSPHRRRESEWITRSRSPKHRRGESEWISLLLIDSPTFLSTSRSTCFGDLHASTSVHHDVCTGGNLLCIMQHFQTQTFTYGFHLSGILFGATFFI